MSLQTALSRGRDRVLDLMVNTCTLAHPGAGTPVFDETTGVSTVPTEPPYFTGPCRIRAEQVTATTDAGDEQVLADRDVAVVPSDVTEVRRGDVLKITASPDGALVNRAFRVADVGGTEAAVARRLVLQRNG
jgi:hypothetical protein